MNELEIDVIQKLLNDEQLLNVVKKFFYREINKSCPDVDKTDNNEILGQKYRAYLKAQELIDNCFAEIETYKSNKVETIILNNAR